MSRFAHAHNIELPWFGGGARVCARCFGVYGGMVGWAGVFAVWPGIFEYVTSFGFTTGFGWWFGLTLPLVIDWWMQCLGWRHSTNGVRLVTAVIFALAVVSLVAMYRYFLVFGPVAVLWVYIVATLGHHWRAYHRPPYWGCDACETGTVGEALQRNRLQEE